MSLRLPAYGEFDCDIDFDSQEWGCSKRGTALTMEANPLERVKVKITVKFTVCCSRAALRATPLLIVKAKFTVKNAVCMSLRLPAYGEFDCDFDYDSQEWGCSKSA